MANKLNRAGRTHAKSLIASNDVDKTAAWSFTAEDGNALLGPDGNDWAKYGSCHLGVDMGEDFNTKDHWKYPFAKIDTTDADKKDIDLYRSGLMAIRSRASGQSDKEIFDAAGALLDEIDGNSDRTHENDAGVGPNALFVNSRPPRIEVIPRMDSSMECAPVSEDALARWQAGIRAQNSDDANVIQIFDVIGYDFWSGGGVTCDTVASALKAAGGNPVEVHVNSPGGDMFEGIAIYNLLRNYPAKITMKVMGLAASAASVIAMAGNEILVSPSSFIMIHNCWVMAMGNRHDMADVASYLEPFDAALRDIYVAKSGQKAPDVESWMDADTYMNGSEAIARKFATGSLPDNQVTENKDATSRAKALNAVRMVEASLTKGGKTRSQARAIIKQMHATKQDAGGADGTKPGAGADVTQDADVSTIAAIRALIDQTKSI